MAVDVSSEAITARLMIVSELNMLARGLRKKRNITIEEAGDIINEVYFKDGLEGAREFCNRELDTTD